MIEPTSATILVCIFAVFLLILIPLIDGSKRFGKFISLRYTITAVMVSMMLGCILDFSHLAESSRNIVLYGGIIIAGIFIIVRTLDKIKLGGKHIEISAEKGDAKITTTITGEKTPLHKENRDATEKEN